MICSRCKTQNPDGNTFCLECGNSLDPFVTTDNNSYQPQNGSVGNDQFIPGSNQYSQPQSYQQPYQQNMVNYPAGYGISDDEHVSVLNWIGIFAINLIPVIGSIVYIVLLFVWALGDTRKKSLKTFAQAQLIICLVVFVLCFILFGIMGLTLNDWLNTTKWD